MNRVIDARFYNQPGFTTLYDAWDDVFEKQGDGYVLDSAEALARVFDARTKVIIEESLPDSDVTSLDHIACRYAQEMQIRADEVVDEWR